ncbi:ArdC family protein [Variovorax saccharolyticus]|uniref:ArdC family protein n=1 Tax=Variovorax saccharolyticus TaxID=3053516 RepID=UPI002575CD62|nr:zincin-like metallopeptidase domain-containing protein [Variovorax sp. J22R187]MDM0022656.1 zincin-like metallopeptidase domain-containing protein [Variovorax sp. J22R187]
MRALSSSRQRNARTPTATGVPPVPPEDSPQAGAPAITDAGDRRGARSDVRQSITDRIIAMLEKGGNVFRQRWTRAASRGVPRNGKTGAPYHGANVLLLWDAAIERGYASNVWLTYKQAAGLGAQVRRRERAVLCAHFERMSGQASPGVTGESLDDSERLASEGRTSARGESSFLRCRPFWLFNVAQMDGLPIDPAAETASRAWTDRSPIEGAMRFIGGCGATIQHGFERAAYAPHADRILMPDIDRFTSPEAYCATALHELVHWTGHPDRLARAFGKRFGDAAYAFEELVAELGSAFVLGHIGLVDATIEGHAAYLDAWLQVLRNDRTAIFTAARLAGEAYELILSRALPEAPSTRPGTLP